MEEVFQGSGGVTWQEVQNFGSKTTSESVVVIPMPKLSPQMTHGTLSKWLKKEGDAIKTYDVVMEVTTDNLTEEGYKTGDLAGQVTLLVEAQEEGRLGKVLVQEGQKVDVGTPLALMSDDTSDANSLKGYKLPTTNVYDAGQPHARMLIWQSYLKEGGKSKGGCMV